MIPGGPLYVFSIEMGYTREKLVEILDQKLQKLEENYRFFMNGHFQEPNQKPRIRIDAEKSVGFDSAIKKILYKAKRRVMKHPKFQKNK